MRIFRYIFDLPWWVGLPIFLGGNLLIPMGLYGYISGLIICLFGGWTFSKLLKPNEYIEAGQAIVCIPLTALSLYLFNKNWIFDHFIPTNSDTLYVLRIVFGLFFGFLSFQGFRK